MLTLGIDQRQLQALSALVDGKSKRLQREIKTAINAAAKKTKTVISKQIRTELATKASSVNKTISIATRASEGSLSSTVRLSRTSRIPLRDFGARQNKRGVSYKTSKKKGRRFVAGAFQGPRPGQMKASWRGRVFKREGEGKLPIVQLFGPSPWGVFVKQSFKPKTVKQANIELRKQIDRRVRFLSLKASGKI